MKLVALLLLPILGFGQIKADQKLNLLEDKLEISIPKELSKMTDEKWKLKYGNTARPFLALSDNDVEISLVGQFTNQTWDEKELSAYKDFRIANLKKTRTDIQVLAEGVKDVNGKKIGFFKFVSQAGNDKIFNYYFFCIVDERIVLFNFNCTGKWRADWEKVADDIVASVKVK